MACQARDLQGVNESISTFHQARQFIENTYKNCLDYVDSPKCQLPAETMGLRGIDVSQHQEIIDWHLVKINAI